MANRTATLRFEDGSAKTFPVRNDIDLSKHKEGEKVTFIVTEAVALSVEKPSDKVNPLQFGLSIYGWFPDIKTLTIIADNHFVSLDVIYKIVKILTIPVKPVDWILSWRHVGHGYWDWKGL